MLTSDANARGDFKSGVYYYTIPIL